MVENEAYVHVLKDTLKRKKELLLFLLSKTKEQEQILAPEKMDITAFENILAEKKEKIEVLTELDEGFEAIFKRVSAELLNHKDNYKDDIIQMQTWIKEITELSMQIQSLEHKNSERFKLHLAREKSAIRESAVSSRMATSYYQNMTSQGNADNSYFFNTTK